MLNLRGVDLNLLPVFEAVYEERSLSRAATRLAMTQPAVSHAMTRLRGVFEDALFIRQSRGMAPTAVADVIYAGLRDALASVRTRAYPRPTMVSSSSTRSPAGKRTVKVAPRP